MWDEETSPLVWELTTTYGRLSSPCDWMLLAIQKGSETSLVTLQTPFQPVLILSTNVLEKNKGSLIKMTQKGCIMINKKNRNLLFSKFVPKCCIHCQNNMLHIMQRHKQSLKYIILIITLILFVTPASRIAYGSHHTALLPNPLLSHQELQFL